MKKIFNNILLLLLASVIVLSCKEDEKVVVAFSLSAEELAFGEDGGTELVEVTSNSKWQATTDATWLKVSPSSGLESGVCEIAVDSSVVADYRNAEIMFIGLFGTANYFGRLANYFLIFQALCLPHLFKAFNETSRKLITSACIIGFLLYFYYANVINQNFDSMFNYVPFINYIKSIIGSLFL